MKLVSQFENDNVWTLYLFENKLEKELKKQGFPLHGHDNKGLITDMNYILNSILWLALGM